MVHEIIARSCLIRKAAFAVIFSWLRLLVELLLLVQNASGVSARRHTDVIVVIFTFLTGFEMIFLGTEDTQNFHGQVCDLYMPPSD